MELRAAVHRVQIFLLFIDYILYEGILLHIEVIVHFPHSKQGKEELAKRVATAHAQAVLEHIRRLNCPTAQKVALLNAIQERVREQILKEKEG